MHLAAVRSYPRFAPWTKDDIGFWQVVCIPQQTEFNERGGRHAQSLCQPCGSFQLTAIVGPFGASTAYRP
ncbi:hypothetical protein BofuT4_uP123370.1 [Botrytis cinerea T4]|uniref:Uncharacterized protein n=1 Tax=Botryotinia fuckeliana (strain T4) TaxID=999810 RepID=G2YNX0_BOTF4|nr:hypothetical protein BofuT4_uP123370.1 [Botrytis cinerea T4]